MTDCARDEDGAGTAGWTWLLVGLLGTTLLRSACERPPIPSAEAMAELGRGAVELETAGARALRRLPGIGNRRAVQLVRARWAHDPVTGPLRLGDLPGIGPKTVERVSRALASLEPPIPSPRPEHELVVREARPAAP